MKAITISQHGGPEVMKFSDIPLPEVGPDQVLVQISAVGVNFIDIYQRSGLYPIELPAIPGLEGAGQRAAVEVLQHRTQLLCRLSFVEDHRRSGKRGFGAR